MNQATIFECTKPQRDVAYGYELVLPTGEVKVFGTLCELLQKINVRIEFGKTNPYSMVEQMLVYSHRGTCLEMKRTCNHIGIKMPPGTGHVQDIMDGLLGEVLPFARGEGGKMKQPWQMTASQWGAISILGSIAYGVVPCLNEQHFKQQCTLRNGGTCSVEQYVSSELLAVLGYGHNGPVYDGHQINSRHEVHVAYALARGDDVPNEVLQDYMTPEGRYSSSDIHWMTVLLDKPFLRGRLSGTRLSMLMSLLRGERDGAMEITQENAPFLIKLMNSLPENVSFVDCDNLLYANGVLKVREMPPGRSLPDLGAPINVFAQDLREMQIANRVKTQRDYIDQEMSKGNLSQREKDFKESLLKDIPLWESFAWANKVVKAIEEKNLQLLLEMLDGTTNDTTKRAIEKHYPVKLRNVSAAARRRGIFALIGHVTAEQVLVAECTFKAEQLARKQTEREENERKRIESRLEDSKEIAARIKISFKGVLMNGAEFVEKIIQDGFNQIASRKRGAVSKCIVRNAELGQFYELKRNNGTADYAEALLERMPQLA